MPLGTTVYASHQSKEYTSVASCRAVLACWRSPPPPRTISAWREARFAECPVETSCRPGRPQSGKTGILRVRRRRDVGVIGTAKLLYIKPIV